MMKKVLVLMLVLGMVSAASAGLQISVDGDPEPVDSEIILLPSETVVLDLWTDTDIGMLEFGAWALIVADGSQGAGTVGQGDSHIAGFNVIGPIPGTVGVTAPGVGWFGTYLGAFSGNPFAGDVVYDNFLFHCEGEGDVIIEVWSMEDVGVEIEDWQAIALMDSLVIHQIPEPMTIALLGLGALFLRRRK